MEQPLPPGGPMNGVEFAMPPMGQVMGDSFPQHAPLTSPSDETTIHNGCESLDFLVSSVYNYNS